MTSLPKLSNSSYPSTKVIWISAATFVLIGGLALLTLPNLLLHNWFPGSDESERRGLLASAAQIILFALGGVIAVVGVALSVSRHGQELEANERDRAQAQRLQEAHDAARAREEARAGEVENVRLAETERELRGRFVSAVDLLSSSDHSAGRVAALHVLAALADDWDALDRKDEVQVCIEMLCTYLRAPHTGSSSGLDEKLVQLAGYEILRSRLRAGAAHSWSPHRIRLTGATIDFDANLSDIRVGSVLDLSGVTIESRGRLRMTNATIARYGRVNLRDAVLRDSAGLDLSSVCLEHSSSIMLRGARLSDKANLYLRGVTLREGSDVNLLKTEISDDARVHLRGADLDNGTKIRVRSDFNWSSGSGTALTARDLPMKSAADDAASPRKEARHSADD